MGKGESTKAQVLTDGLAIASERGLDGLTIGTLATRTGLSKSGLYAHFSSKEELQRAVLDAGADLFMAEVTTPAFAAPRGRARIDALIEQWMRWEADVLPGGCIFIAAAAEYDDKPGPVRDRLVEYLERMRTAIERAAAIAVEEGHFRADLDLRTYSFEFWGLVLGYQQFLRLMDAPDARTLALGAFDALNERASA